MDIRLYNTLSRKIETFTPLTKGAVSMYQCGPTLYDTPHIGNYRTFVMNDLLRRMFEYNDLTVTQIMNVTDVDDKTIKRSRDENVSLGDLTSKYGELFARGSQSLDILPPTKLIRATDSIDDMIALVGTLLDKGVAYKADDGIYVSIDKVKNYGELAHLDTHAKSHERISNDEYDKDNPRDFAVWKFRAPEDGDIFWKATFGDGRPGWHIECSAMSMKALGPTFDLHTGGMDLIFPHHTNEIAQSESATGKKFVNYWVHGGFMTVADEKMAKSKKNFYKLEDLLDESISPLGFRYWLLTAHYRSPVNFTLDAVRAAQNALIKLMKMVGDMPKGGVVNDSYRETFLEAITNDLNMPQAVALAWELMKDTNISDADKRATLVDFDRVFGLKLDSVPVSVHEEIPAEILALADAREEARKEKDWKKSDALRAEIEARGYTLKDTPSGAEISRM